MTEAFFEKNVFNVYLLVNNVNVVNVSGITVGETSLSSYI